MSTKLRYEALLDKFTLDCETTETLRDKALVRHELPFRNGAILQDMGMKAREVRLRTHWYNDTYAAHIDFLNHLDLAQLFTLIHPVYGLMQGSVQGIVIHQADTPAACEIDFTFVEELIDASGLTKSTISLVATAEAAFTQSASELVNEQAIAARRALAAQAALLSAKQVSPLQSMLSQFNNASSALRSYLRSVDIAMNQIRNVASQVTQPMDNALALISFAQTVPGICTQTILGAVARIGALYDSLTPPQFVSTFFAATDAVANDAGILAPYVQAAAASYGAMKLAYMYDADETNRNAMRQIEQSKTFDSLGNYTAPPLPDPIMSMSDIEATLAAARRRLQAVIENFRDMESLKDMAAALLRHVKQIKLETDLIVTIHTSSVLPLHLICRMAGLPYNYAERLKTINPQIQNPSFVPAGEVNVYAQ